VYGVVGCLDHETPSVVYAIVPTFYFLQDRNKTPCNHLFLKSPDM